MRKHHARLNRIMEGILKCDRILRIDKQWTNGEGTPNFQHKYSRIRERLYMSYANQLQRMTELIIPYADRA